MNGFAVGALALYIGILFVIARFSQTKVNTEDDFLVGGRSFNLWMTTLCLFATWFGAGSLMTSTDEISSVGLKATALEPFGAGFCLLFAGFFFAKPLWDLKISTYSDFFRLKFGKKAELISVFLNVPVYTGWVAVQYIALAHILQIFFPMVPLFTLVILVCAFTMLITLMGGLWSVSLTDSFQLVLIIIGLVYLFFKVLSFTDIGVFQLLNQVSKEHMVLIPLDKLPETLGWFTLFSVAALGNLTGQDLAQRIFAAKCPTTAQKGCLFAGFTYILVGLIPVFLGLTAKLTLGEFEGPIIPLLIQRFLDPISGVILTLTILSAVTSTITAALLAPASMLSHNFLVKQFPNASKLKVSRLSVVLIAAGSLLTALIGSSAYSLLENCYAIGLVAFFVPVVIGLFTNYTDEIACVVTIVLSTSIWCLEFIIGGDFPYALFATFLGFPIYFSVYFLNTKLAALKTEPTDFIVDDSAESNPV